MTLPTIHSNGTSRESLMEALSNAGRAVRLASEALEQTAPNGRDYYPQGPEAFRDAMAEHTARAAALRTVYQELQALAIGIDEQEG